MIKEYNRESNICQVNDWLCTKASQSSTLTDHLNSIIPWGFKIALSIFKRGCWLEVNGQPSSCTAEASGLKSLIPVGNLKTWVCELNPCREFRSYTGQCCNALRLRAHSRLGAEVAAQVRWLSRGSVTKQENSIQLWKAHWRTVGSSSSLS